MKLSPLWVLPSRLNSSCFATGLLVLVGGSATSALQGQPSVTSQAAIEDFTTLDLERLSEVQISSLGRKRALVFTTPGAATILSGEEIERGGVTDLGAALQLVPGLQVARADSLAYGVTARGFADLTSNKLLVLNDGRSIYDPSLSGTQWTFQTPFLADTLRIEVLRGSGAALWGANAMNGVVNIVSRSAHETLGSYLSAGTGNELEAYVAARQGWKVTPASALRIYGQLQSREEVAAPDRTDQGWSHSLVGSRFDWERGDGATLTVIGEHRGLRLDRMSRIPQLAAPYSLLLQRVREESGSSLMTRWQQPVGDHSELEVQGSWERYDRDDAFVRAHRTTLSLDANFNVRLPANDLMVGADLRRYRGRLDAMVWHFEAPPRNSLDFVGFFAQDEITLLPRKLSLTAGLRWERNSYTGWEFQPNLKATFTPDPTQTWWGGVSRAVRTPSAADRTTTTRGPVYPPSGPGLPPMVVEIIANPDQDSEVMTSWELGYRKRLSCHWNLDTTFFVNDYDRLRGVERNALVMRPGPPPAMYLLAYVGNSTSATAWGGETTLAWSGCDGWSADLSYTRVNLSMYETITGVQMARTTDQMLGDTPRDEARFHLGIPLARHWTLDLWTRHASGFSGTATESRWALDARLGWQVSEHCLLEVGGRDLTDPLHRELSQLILNETPREIGRTVYSRVSLRF